MSKKHARRRTIRERRKRWAAKAFQATGVHVSTITAARRLWRNITRLKRKKTLDELDLSAFGVDMGKFDTTLPKEK